MMEASESSPLSSVLEQAKDLARREPTKAVLSAFGLGLMLNFVPLGALAGAAVSLAVGLVRPALLFLGLIKACELCQITSQLTEPHD